MARETLGQRIASLEGTYRESQKNVTAALNRLETTFGEYAKKTDNMLLNHDRKITRNSVKIKLLMGGIGGGGAITGIIIGIINAV